MHALQPQETLVRRRRFRRTPQQWPGDITREQLLDTADLPAWLNGAHSRALRLGVFCLVAVSMLNLSALLVRFSLA